MGTNAIPFLVREALFLRRESRLRTRLHELFLEVPEWAGRGAFVPYADCVNAAVELLRSLSPPAEVVMPLLEPSLASPDPWVRHQAILILGFLGEGGQAAVPLLLGFATQSEDRQAKYIAWQSIRLLGNRGSNALPALLERRAGESETFQLGFGWPEWLANLGPQALPAVPLLERGLEQTNAFARMGSALALLRLQPEHIAALNIVRAEAEAAKGEDRRVLEKNALLNGIWRFPAFEDERLAAWVEPMARKEATNWDLKRGGSMMSMYALEKVSKARARRLYEELMNEEGISELLGAMGLLRLDPNHSEATQRLVKALPGGPGVFPMFFHALGFASGTNAVAIRALEGVVSGSLEIRPLSIHGNWDAIHRAQAREALSRIRYRAARAAKGLPEREW